jgi:tetratricopeptide (TPR) repeat protein
VEVGRRLRRLPALLDHGTLIDPLRAYWDFDDLDGTEARFRALRAEALTQLARVEGLRERYAYGDRLLDEAADVDETRVRIRVDLERGRLRRSAGDREAALPLFERAFAAALEAGEDWLAGDAAHMAALAAPDRDGFVAWTRRGLELAERSEAAAHWAGPLLNNLGWEHFDAGENEEALALFERALEARLRDPENAAAIEHAREAVAEARRALESE